MLPHQAPPPERTGATARHRAPYTHTHAPDSAPLTPEEARTVASWDRDLDALTGELLRARQSVTEVPLPPPSARHSCCAWPPTRTASRRNSPAPCHAPRSPPPAAAPASTPGSNPASKR
ncbi:hypothetical protein GCM10020256_24740 [Streptomyces thermocoprophilus]